VTDTLAKLTATLADRYRVDRELGAGGMATVYLAEDLKHHRQVAIKVLRPELASAMGPERFTREIEIAARLQHPHILAVYDSGEANGLLYYVMPFVEGESLAGRIARDGALPTDAAVRILREVADALGYAHQRDLVHRDIKPDNILLSGQHALVADFGIARAAHDAGERLTATGLALGTPSYMAPEQASGEQLDQRADIYALGVVAYEMLAGEPPFRGSTAQMVVSAHLTETPKDITKHRPSLPPALGAMVMRCLAKHPADRPQTADEVLRALDSLGTPSGGFAQTAVTPADSPQSPSIHRAAILFAAVSLVILGAAYGLMVVLGLPDWVVPAAAVLLVVGLPIVLTTSRLESRRTPGSEGHRFFNWRRALRGGAVAFGGLVLAVAAYMGMRAFGIGPVGTLVASGVLDEHPRVILADFSDRSNDPTLATAVTEAFRVDLGQSPAIELVQPAALADAFTRMEREPPALLSEDLAREVAVREGIKAVVAGEINAAGGSYIISARIVDPVSGDVLVPLRETASDSTGIVPAVDRLSRKIRERVGESLRTIRESPPLSKVTTASLPALRKHTQAGRAVDDGDIDRGIALFREAIDLDSTFAAAYSGLATTLSNFGIDRALAAEAGERAFRNRDRLTERERLWTEGSYYMRIQDLDAARTVYQSLLESGLESDSARLLNNLGVVNILDRRGEEALGYYRRAYNLEPDQPNATFNIVATSVDLGRLDEARAVAARFDSLRPGHPSGAGNAYLIAWGAREYDSASAALDRFAAAAGSVGGGIVLHNTLWLAGLRGGPAGMAQVLRQSGQQASEGQRVPEHLRAAAWVATYQAVVQGKPEDAIKRMDAALSDFPLATLEPFDRPYAELAEFFARAGRPGRARQLLDEFEREVPRQLHTQVRAELGRARAYTSLADGRAQDAIEEFIEADVGMCKICALPGLSRAWQEVGNEDSVLAVLQRYVTMPEDDRMTSDPLELAGAYSRLGELYEARGDTAQALAYNAKFLQLWSNADPEFAPILERVRERQRRLTAER
jgi:tetratricopeptide (TPR) repeat protein/tRNA A-37 threonylcarbamoyl transferase component Bud32